MGKIAETVFRDWNDGDIVNALDYKQEREIIRTAINDTHDRYLADEATIQQELERLEAFGYEGVYDATVTYGTNSFVLYDNALWIALQTTTGNTPAEGVYWETLLTVKAPVENAEQATTDANNAAATATTQGNTAESQGNTAEAQGNTAETQGNTAQSQGNTAQTHGEFAQTQGNYAKDQGDYIANAQHLGDYDPAVTYQPLNQVLYNGSTYTAIAETTGNAPTDVQFWELSALKGTDGEGSVGSVNSVSPDGTGNVTLVSSDIASEFPPEAHTHPESEITDLDKYTQTEVNTTFETKADATTHREDITSEEGRHGIRHWNEKLEIKVDGAWSEPQTGVSKTESIVHAIIFG